MKKFLLFFASFLFAYILGSYGTYYYLEKNNKESITKIEKSVIVNENGISDGIDNVYKSVVVIQTYNNEKKLNGIGSGFIYDAKGYVLTNYHVIEDADKLNLTLSNGEKIDAQIIGSDEYSDIAVLKINKTNNLDVAKIGSSNDSKIGDTVFAIGSPMNIDYSGTVTRGILSAKNRLVSVSVNSKKKNWLISVLQTDTAINPGNSGGPLCNVSGEVIGINSMKVVEEDVDGISFSIPIEDAIKFANRIITKRNLKGSYLGIKMGEVRMSKSDLLTYEINEDIQVDYGVIVLDVMPSSPAEAFGIKKGDVIIEIDGKKVENTTSLKYFLYKYNAEETTVLKVIRNKKEKIINVILKESN